MQHRQGFTLIELLIVVAIIAILAAIAVPNFLEAQVRSKVARTQSELRILSLALETYRIDNARYPRADLGTRVEQRLPGLTTPVAYLTSLPQDPFFKSAPTQLGGTSPVYVYASGNIYFGNATLFNNTQYIGTIYSVAGRGPDRDINFGGYCMAHPIALQSGAHLRGAYDPTNGTISPGDIIRLSPGTLGVGP
jgi:type II secretion system protein G